MQRSFAISLKLSAALTALSALGTGAAFAQGQPPPPPPPAKHGFLHNMFHRPKPGQVNSGRPMPGRPVYNTAPGHTMGGHPNYRPMGGRPGYRPMGGMMGSGSIVGNKNTHVYHMAGDRGAMPAEQNRVYFRSEREAEAAGFRRAGTSSGNHSMGNRTMHGSPRTGTPGVMNR